MSNRGDGCVVVRGTEILVDERGAEPTLTALADVQAMEVTVGVPVSLGALGETRVLAAAAAKDVPLPAGFAFRPVRTFFFSWPEETLNLVGLALAVVEFEDTHRFCGRCGKETAPGAEGGRVRLCAGCGLSFYPRIPPAVIVLVTRGDEILLARGPNFPPGRFGAVAGFVELGESLEGAVRREVEEEVGVHVEDVRYFGSQPWPFGRSLMIGFRARFAGGELRPDGQEIVEAGWFRRDALPTLPPKLSMARKLIDAFFAEG